MDRKQIVIIGGGLAGSFMAARLCHQGHEVTLIDDRTPTSASRVAAGLYNVITGRFGAKTWMAETLLSEIESFYQIPEFQSLKAHVHPMPIYRPFREIQHYNKWLGKAEDPAFSKLVAFHEQPILPDQIDNPHGGIVILPCGWIDSRALVESMQELLVRDYGLNLVETAISYDQIDLAQKQISLGGIQERFDEIVFCEGPRLNDNPFFPQVEVIPNKGEILRIEAPDLELPFVLSKKVYVISHDDHTFIVGSNYENHPPHTDPTEAAKEEISSHLQKAIRVPFRVVDQWAGIRPTTKNRRPIIGTHGQYPYAHILGGFGTKGMLLSAHFSRVLAERISGQATPIPNEASLLRFG
ncbi:FAD-binding oxidoreductase [Pontibacter sp. G13]|uniref:NAD(P)/FAD-dependent oxidoreductase n=1 Tax=Pontibacter sp. G13 TaxID=3074898 RepID=UPI002889FD01|nr:FAD-binding oxidoreductase [Pontibacter sp. G13]WNJ21385.1 FAD-binding oxidoreductase [Pontibacter sp. G13]